MAPMKRLLPNGLGLAIHAGGMPPFSSGLSVRPSTPTSPWRRKRASEPSGRRWRNAHSSRFLHLLPSKNEHGGRGAWPR